MVYLESEAGELVGDLPPYIYTRARTHTHTLREKEKYICTHACTHIHIYKGRLNYRTDKQREPGKS